MIAETLVNRVRDLAAPSGPAGRLLDLLRDLKDLETDSSKIIQTVQQDAVLTAKLLALCNSSAIAAAAPISSVEHAVFFLGQSRVFRLALAASFGNRLSARLNTYGIGDNELWSHSLLTAMLAPLVHESLSIVNADASVAYTAGLVHDIGKVVLNQVLDQPTQNSIRALVAAGACSLCEAENSIIGVDHAEVGACLLRKWRLPEAIVEAVAHHHAPVTRPRPEVSAIVHVANVIAHQAGPATGWGSLCFRADEAAVENLGLTPQQTDALLLKACLAMQQVQQLDFAA